MDTSSDAVRDACKDMLKCGQRQMRYNLKKKYFNNVPANEVRITSPVASMTDQQWKALVDKWSSSKHWETFAKNKLNRGKVKFQQKTGSRSYIALLHTLKEKYKEQEPTAIDLFKECHCRKKDGFSEPVKKAIADMQTVMDDAVLNGEEPKSGTAVVSEVLTKIVPTTKFLQNVGLQPATKSSSRGGVASCVQELQNDLHIEKQQKEELRLQLASQQQEFDAFKKAAEESEAARKEEFEAMKKRTKENEAILARLLRLHKSP